MPISHPAGPEVLKPARTGLFRTAAGKILVKAAGRRRQPPRHHATAGGYPPPPGAPATPGLEIAGEVVLRRVRESSYRVGDKVCALVPGGGYAEYCVAAEDNSLPVPQGLSMVEAAAIPETFFTVWTNVFDRAGLKPGRPSVHGGSSGIGTTAIMLAKALGRGSSPRPDRPRNAPPVLRLARPGLRLPDKRISSP